MLILLLLPLLILRKRAQVKVIGSDSSGLLVISYEECRCMIAERSDIGCLEMFIKQPRTTHDLYKSD